MERGERAAFAADRPARPAIWGGASTSGQRDVPGMGARRERNRSRSRRRCRSHHTPDVLVGRLLFRDVNTERRCGHALLVPARRRSTPARSGIPAPARGPHGPSAIVDHGAFVWTDADWRGVPADQLAIYELHVGTFTEEGTFAAAESRLGEIADLGITALELMPIAECAGRWNWGYDGVDLFAPSHNYGTPDDLRRLINAAHAHGLAVILDVVYNHFGPDGAYVHAFSPYFTTPRYQTPWGPGANLDGDHSDVVRAFFIENALHWVHEYRADGLRLDACHELRDARPRHFLAELIESVRRTVDGRTIIFIAEDERNNAALITDSRKGGYGSRRMGRRLPPSRASGSRRRQRRLLPQLFGHCERHRRDASSRLVFHRPALRAPRRAAWIRSGRFAARAANLPVLIHAARRGARSAGRWKNRRRHSQCPNSCGSSFRCWPTTTERREKWRSIAPYAIEPVAAFA